MVIGLRHPEPAAMEKVILAGETHVGLIRKINEDSFCFCSFPGDINALAVVADGIGGHSCGDIASRMCCERFLIAWKNENAGQFTSESELRLFLEKVLAMANNDIYQLNLSRKLPQPMGTTVVAAIFTPHSVLAAHAGDSRLYQMRKGKLNRLTEDHSFVAELVRKRIITEAEAAYHPFSHIISRSVGPAEEVAPEVNIFHREAEDKYVLCSDGLTFHVDEEQITTVLRKKKDPVSAVDQLMKYALIGGGEDNVTVLCAFS